MKSENLSRLLLRASVAFLLANGAAGCASFDVKPWDRDLLARRSMQFNTHPLITAADEHIYFSKEGSSGGRAFGGGGCGCN